MTHDRLAAVLQRSRAVLFDFDGPICSVFAGVPAPSVARHLRESLARMGRPVDLAEPQADDPMEVLQLASTFGADVTSRADDVLTAAEILAVRTATPTPGGAESLQACAASGRKLAIVSNNSANAVRSYLRQHDLLHVVGDGIVGREHGRPHLMKPDPAPILAALELLNVSPASAVLLGDSLTDVVAAHASGVACIGYANKAHKHELLADADVLIDDMRVLASHIAGVPVITTS